MGDLRCVGCYLFESVACNRLEGLLHVDRLLGAGFKVWDVVLAQTPSLRALGWYLKHNVIIRNKLFIELFCLA